MPAFSPALKPLASLCAILSAVTGETFVVPPADISPATYHNWAHKHWVWLHHGQSNQQNTSDLVQGYLDRGIPVGAVNIDSEWATYFNNFEANTEKFPDLPALVSQMHDLDVRVTMWVTSMVNTDNPDYDFCVENNYLVRNAYGVVRPISWWKGDGGLLDYSNPEALSWWHSKMDKVLSMGPNGEGIDGFKTDQTDLYITEYILLSGNALGYQNVSLSYRDYANYYYRDFFYYTREHRGDAGLIMSRPVDCALDRITKVCTPSSPYDVMYSGWVGDDDPTFNGLTGCLRKVLYSAWDNYTNFGCDIGGYRGDSDTQDKQVFIRWAQFGAFIPFMENGGGGEHRPWMYDEETTNIYRKFVLEHYKMIPYLMKTGMESMESGGQKSSIKPLAAKPADTPDELYPQPTTYSFLLGDDILVHPVVNAESVVEMTFPSGETDVWLSWWSPTDMTQAVEGRDSDYSFIRKVELDSYPVYVRKSAFLALQPSAAAADVMFTWFCPTAKDGEVASGGTVVREPSSVGSGMEASVSLVDGTFTGIISAHSGYGAGFTVIGVSSPKSFTSNPSEACEYSYDDQKLALAIFCTDTTLGIIVKAEGVATLF